MLFSGLKLNKNWHIKNFGQNLCIKKNYNKFYGGGDLAIKRLGVRIAKLIEHINM